MSTGEDRDNIDFKMTPETGKVIASILSSKVHKEAIAILFDEAGNKDSEGRIGGLHFNEIWRRFSYSVSRTTLHRTIFELYKRDTILNNEPGQIITETGPKRVSVYRIKDEYLRIVKFLYPSLRP